MPIVVGVDSSTQSCKIELRDAQSGMLLGFGSAAHSPAHGPCSEQNPASWWKAFELALSLAIDHAGCQRCDIAAISVAAQCHGLVPLDAQSEVIRPAKLWNDTQSAPQALVLREKIGIENWIQEVGSLPTAAFTISKIAWLAENEPQNFKKLNRICLPHDWLTLRLCGRHVTDRSDASGTGYWNSVKNSYNLDFLRVIDANRDWEPMLPHVLGPNEAAGLILKDVAKHLGLNSTVIVGAGGGDQHLGALGLAVRERDVVYTIATSGVVFTTSSKPIFDLSGTVDGVANCAGGFLPLVCTLNAARVTDWASQILNVDHDGLSQLALSADPSKAPAFATFLDGERKPDRPTASGFLAGITARTTRADIACSAYQGVLLALVRGETMMNDAGISTAGRVLITGGGARSAAYCQLLADLTQREVEAADAQDANEASARGAAVQSAAILTGQTVQAVSQAWAPQTRVKATPRRDTAGVREKLLDKYRILTNWTGFDGQ